ncbi:MAG: YeeE/YedE family protein [Betaproteobacteria bacterium]|nr:YeeE/YedE family protein [Betaproteobacteria bacterium]
MEFTIHHQILLAVFVIAVIMGAVANKTNFCTMGAVSDWVNIGDTGRMRAWVFAMVVALIGVLGLEAAGSLNLYAETFPPYRTANFAWLRYILGGLLFGIGMTLGSGCGSRTLVRVGNGNLKSLVVVVVMAIAAYFMLWSAFFEKAFMSWIGPTTINLSHYGVTNQELSTVLAAMFGLQSVPWFHLLVGALVAVGMLAFVFKSVDFRGNRDNILGGAVVGLAIFAGWWVTGGAWGQKWKEFAEMAIDVPSRVQVQSYTFVSPMGDTARYLLDPTNLMFINFGVMALTGVILGSFIYAIASRSFRIEWFASGKDFVNHAAGGALMGVGGVLSMGCTVGQAITGVSTLAIGSILTFFAIVIGSAGTMKFQYWRMMQEA